MPIVISTKHWLFWLAFNLLYTLFIKTNNVHILNENIDTIMIIMSCKNVVTIRNISSEKQTGQKIN